MVSRPEEASSLAARSRRSLLAGAAGLSVAAGIGLTATGRAFAQDATPATGGASGTAAPLNTPVTFKNVEGLPVIEITTTKVTDPFQGYNPSYPPPRGNRFILVSLKIENVGANPYAFDHGRIFLQDADAFVIYPSAVDLGPEPVEPGLAYQDVPPATVVEGVIGYTLIQGVTPIRLFYAPASDRLLLLADLV